LTALLPVMLVVTRVGLPPWMIAPWHRCFQAFRRGHEDPSRAAHDGVDVARNEPLSCASPEPARVTSSRVAVPLARATPLPESVTVKLGVSTPVTETTPLPESADSGSVCLELLTVGGFDPRWCSGWSG
jgi:hypothetical protein